MLTVRISMAAGPPGEQFVRSIDLYFAPNSQRWISETDWAPFSRIIASIADLESIGIGTKDPEQQAACTEHVVPHLEPVTHERGITLKSIAFDS